MVSGVNLRSLSIVLVSTLLFAGCGGDESEGPKAPTATTTVTETTESTDEAPGETTPEAEVNPEPDSGPADQFFQSPTGNIGCVVSAGYARCDVAERDWNPGPRPSDCPKITDYGQGIEFEPGSEARLVCAGDTTLGAGKKLPYEESIVKGDVTCTSTEEGVTCGDVEGNGFFISRATFLLSPAS